MLTVALLASTAFSGPIARAPSARSAVRMAEFSESVPFLVKPSKLGKGMAGDVGFDPLYLSEFVDLKWLRESELKHGRICMLGVVGMIVQQFIRLGGPYYDSPNPVEAALKTPPSAFGQIIIFCGIIEFITNNGKMTVDDMFSDSKRVPGDLGFDPLKFGKDASKRGDLELKELKNGRLAMLGFAGLLHQAIFTGTPPLSPLSPLDTY